jgi:hypothetical protein
METNEQVITRINIVLTSHEQFIVKPPHSRKRYLIGLIQVIGGNAYELYGDPYRRHRGALLRVHYIYTSLLPEMPPAVRHQVAACMQRLKASPLINRSVTNLPLADELQPST